MGALVESITDIDPETRRFAIRVGLPLHKITEMRVALLGGLDNLTRALDTIAAGGVDPVPLERQFASWLRQAADAYEANAARPARVR